ncbi:pentapeptide repeat-containing protein [Nostoc sp. CALU 1950]|uniref:pentapeptide repeat-containing protein n=1 Tax=Nostoc sp. CALU 1950 TaxID=3104321 RepID=UPI003EC07072
MSDNKTDTPRNSFIVLILFIGLFIISSFLVAYFVWDISSSDERLKNETEALKTTATIFGGIAVFINAYYAAKRWEAMDKSAEAANKTAKAALQNAQAAQDKQITERFAKAIEQLGNEKIETRLGAIYTLERIAKDSKDDHWTIMEVLTAFVRVNAPLKPQEEVKKGEVLKLRTAIRVVITVIERRHRENDPEDSMIDLSETDLSEVNLNKVNLQGAKFTGANLQQAKFKEANLQGANLSDANLYQAYFPDANLQDADLTAANLERSQLWRANLQQADLKVANLEGAYLCGANLQGANFWGANLQSSSFSDANLQSANFETADLKGAYLKEAKNLEQHQIESAKGDRTTILPENLQPPEHWEA